MRGACLVVARAVRFQTFRRGLATLRLRSPARPAGDGRRDSIDTVYMYINRQFAPSVAEWSKAPEFDAETGGESPVQAPVWAVTFSPYV